MPNYLTDVLEIYQPNRSLRSEIEITLKIPRCQTKFAERSFSIAGPQIWNSLPKSIRNRNSVGSFKYNLKKHLLANQ